MTKEDLIGNYLVEGGHLEFEDLDESGNGTIVLLYADIYSNRNHYKCFSFRDLKKEAAFFFNHTDRKKGLELAHAINEVLNENIH